MYYKQVNGVKIKLTEDEEKTLKILKNTWDSGATDRQKEKLRNMREPLLQEADIAIFKLEDVNSDTTKWRQYRKELRDITAQSDIFNVTWPNKPE